MRLRTLGAAVAAVLVAATLAGCRTNVGVAATVNGDRITESDVNGYLTPGGPKTAPTAASGDQLVPKSQVVQTLVQENLFTSTLKANGGVPSAGALAKLHDPAAQVLVGSSASGDAFDTAIGSVIKKTGLTDGFVKRYIHTLELEYAIVKRLKLSQLSELAATVKKAGASVSVNPRYGAWDPKSLDVTTTGGAGLPAFIKLQPTPGVSSSSTDATQPTN